MQPMAIARAIEYLNEKIEGLRLSIYCEELVVAALQPVADQLLRNFQVNTGIETTADMRRQGRQHLKSKSDIREWTRELDALCVAVHALKAMSADIEEPTI